MSNTLTPLRSVYLDTLREMECLLTVIFSSSPNLPTIYISPRHSQRDPFEAMVYRSLVDFFFHWALVGHNFHLHHYEIQATLLTVARRYGKVQERAEVPLVKSSVTSPEKRSHKSKAQQKSITTTPR